MSSDGLDGATSLPEELPPTFENELLDVGDAASWTASSFKAGHGIEALRSLDPTVYFESCGPAYETQHVISLNFSAKKTVSYLAILLDYTTDDSYTPKQLRVCAGTLASDLEPIATPVLSQASGWVIIPFPPPDAPEDPDTKLPPGRPLHHIRVEVISCEQNGKDMRIRCMRVFGPLPPPITLLPDGYKAFVTPDCRASAVLR